jgi:hypothetical protein
MKNLLLTLLFLLPANAVAGDSYNPQTGEVHMPYVKAGAKNFEVKMIDQGGLVFKVISALPISSIITMSDTFDNSTGLLHMPNVSIAADNFEVEMIHQGDLVFKFISSLKVNFKFTTSYLNGKTLYNAYLSDGGDDSNDKWQIETFTFTDTTASSFLNDVPNTNVDDIPYSITSEGYILIHFPSFSLPDYIKATGTAEDYLVLNWTELENIDQPTEFNEFFYFDLQKAQAFIDVQNANNLVRD